MDAFKATAPKAGKGFRGQKVFTIETARRALPLVRRIVIDVVRQYLLLLDVQKGYQELLRQGPSEALEAARDRRQEVAHRLSELAEELDLIGCELKDYEIGMVDFPAIMDGRQVYLCWKLGEETIEYWHEVLEGAAGRRPLAARQAAV
ncbi:MAG: DUF2203 domain-containing protein [Phycisphaerae bacterium]